MACAPMHPMLSLMLAFQLFAKHKPDGPFPLSTADHRIVSSWFHHIWAQNQRRQHYFWSYQYFIFSLCDGFPLIYGYSDELCSFTAVWRCVLWAHGVISILESPESWLFLLQCCIQFCFQSWHMHKEIFSGFL